MKKGEFPEENNFKEAIDYYKKIIENNPDFFEAYYYLADTLFESGDFHSAIRYYRRAIALNPESFACFNNLGNIYIELGNLENAMECFQKALSLKPDSPQILNNIGFISGELNEWEFEIKYYKQAIQIEPEFIEPYHNLGIAYERQGKITEARQCYQKVFSAETDNLLYKLHIDTICPVIPFNNEEIDKYRNELLITLQHYIHNKIPVDFTKLLSTNAELPHNLVNHGRDELFIRKKYAEIFNNVFPEFRHQLSDKKRHIAIVATDSHEPVFCKSMKGILENIDKERFKITIVYNKSGIEPYFRGKLNDSLNYLALKGDFSQIIKTMAEQKFDIIYYWEVDTDTLNYFLPFCRLAPVQCTSWGWQATTGIPNIDYYISSELVETEASDRHYSEKLIRLKSLPVYYYRPPVPVRLKNRSYFGLQDNQHIYLCAQNLRKIHPDFDSIIAEILRRDNNSIIILFKDKVDNISELLYERIKYYYPEVISQIKFMQRMNEADYLNLISVCNIALDTIYYGGVNTTYDALACATPVITMPTEFHRGRYTYGIYKSMGIFDCIASSEEEYINLAIKIAGNPQLRTDISNKIKDRNYLIFENNSAVAELAEFFASVMVRDLS